MTVLQSSVFLLIGPGDTSKLKHILRELPSLSFALPGSRRALFSAVSYLKNVRSPLDTPPISAPADKKLGRMFHWAHNTPHHSVTGY